MGTAIRECSCIVGENAIHVEGLFLYRNECGSTAVKLFLEDFLETKISFDDIYGAYLAEIDLPDRQVFFSDNSGMRRFFIHWEDARFEKTFIAALPKEERNPNYAAIAQFLYFGCVYNSETIEKHVIQSSAGSYYEVRGGKIEEKSKMLAPLKALDADEEILGKMMRTVCKAIPAYGECFCTITGGVDSRSVLAHLLHNGIAPRLDITGSVEHEDVLIAKKIADKLGLELLAVEDSPEQGWIPEAMEGAAQGMFGVCGIYRLYKKAKRLQEIGDVLEFGGLAGEMYKNSFINQDFPFYSGNPDWGKFIKYKVMTFDFPQRICGKEIASEIYVMGKTLAGWLRQFDREEKATAYLEAGYTILQQRSAGVSAMNAQHYTAYNPLIERKVAAYGFHKSPWRLEMQAFQRKQVSQFCPLIKDIRTDRGLTCSDGKIVSEWAKSMAFLCRVGLERLVMRKKAAGRVDACFREGLRSPQYLDAFRRCQELRVLSEAAEPEDIPVSIADRAFLVGSVL